VARRARWPQRKSSPSPIPEDSAGNRTVGKNTKIGRTGQKKKNQCNIHPASQKKSEDSASFSRGGGGGGANAKRTGRCPSPKKNYRRLRGKVNLRKDIIHLRGRVGRNEEREKEECREFRAYKSSQLRGILYLFRKGKRREARARKVQEGGRRKGRAFTGKKWVGTGRRARLPGRREL